MLKTIRHHQLDYNIFALGSLLFLCLFFLLHITTATIVKFTLVYSLFYITWGFWHHYRHRSLRFSVVLEYILISILAISLSYFLTI